MASLMSYLDNGGRLFLTGQEIGYDVGLNNFYNDYLHSLYITDDAMGTSYTGRIRINNTDYDLFVELPLTYGDGARNQKFIDAIKPLDGITAFYIAYNDAYQFSNGSSMSTAMVSGVAALISSYYNNFNADQIKGTIIKTVDVQPSLQGRIVSGGRVNAYSALTSLSRLPVFLQQFSQKHRFCSPGQITLLRKMHFV